MFVLSKQSFFPCNIAVPVYTATGVETANFTAHFTRDTDKIGEAVKLLGDENIAAEVRDQRIANSVLIGWTGVQDEAAKEVEFSPENRDALLNVFPVRKKVVEAFLTAYLQMGEAQAKNSGTPLAGGPAAAQATQSS
jgi:hypothetical protein